MDTLCRFCLFQSTEDGNAELISPCDCIGSIQYVHLDCLLQWRRTTDNYECIAICQLCQQPYRLPTHWPLEDKPEPGHDGAWFLLSKPFVWIILSYYLYFSILYYAFPELFKPIHVIVYPQMIYNIELQENEIVEQEQQQPIGNTYPSIYATICAAITLLYMLCYYRHVKALKNKIIYLIYWTKTLDYPFVWNPTKLLFVSIGSFILMCFNVSFGIVYLYLLPEYYHTHCVIIQQMNMDAEYK